MWSFLGSHTGISSCLDRPSKIFFIGLGIDVLVGMKFAMLIISRQSQGLSKRDPNLGRILSKHTQSNWPPTRGYANFLLLKSIIYIKIYVLYNASCLDSHIS